MKPTNLIWEKSKSIGDWTLLGTLDGMGNQHLGVVSESSAANVASVFYAYSNPRDGRIHHGKGSGLNECGRFPTLEEAKAAVEVEVNK